MPPLYMMHGGRELWCCPSVDFLLLFGAADTCAACSASVARSCRARWRTCAEGTTRPPAKPGLLLASVSTDASALFFSCVFCASSFFLLAPRNRCRSRWHSIGLPSWPFCTGGLPSTRPRRGATQANRMPAPGPDSAAYFFWDRARMRRLSTFLSILRVDLSPGDRSEACSRAGQPAKTLSISQFRVTIQVEH